MEWIKQVLESLQRPTVVLKNGDGDKRRSLTLHPGQKRPVGWRHVGGWTRSCGQNQWNIPRATCTERPTLSTFQKVFSNTDRPEWPWMTLNDPVRDSSIGPIDETTCWPIRTLDTEHRFLKFCMGGKMDDDENEDDARPKFQKQWLIYIITAESSNDAYCAHCNLTSQNNKWRSRLWKR